MNLDVVIRNGRVFDGTGVPGAIRDLGIRDGVVVAVSTEPLDGEGAKEIDATGHWVLPGFVDVHTHYDAEVLAAPGLEESVRHGVTTVVMGSCSLSTILSDPEDSADMFSRVEAVPHEHVLSTLAEHQTWDDAATYIDALESLPLGPNVAAFLGHSDLRASVMAWAAPGAAAACCKARRMRRRPCCLRAPLWRQAMHNWVRDWSPARVKPARTKRLSHLWTRRSLPSQARVTSKAQWRCNGALIAQPRSKRVRRRAM